MATKIMWIKYAEGEPDRQNRGERRKRQIPMNQVDQDHCEYTKTQIRLQTL